MKKLTDWEIKVMMHLPEVAGQPMRVAMCELALGLRQGNRESARTIVSRWAVKSASDLVAEAAARLTDEIAAEHAVFGECSPPVPSKALSAALTSLAVAMKAVRAAFDAESAFEPGSADKAATEILWGTGDPHDALLAAERFSEDVREDRESESGL
jgi:hypothetical protein